MAATERVPAPRVPFGGRGNVAALVLLGLVVLLIAKPWGSPAARADPAPMSAAASAGPTPAPTLVEAGFGYDQSVFGPFEPAPEWSVWPGGFFVTVLYVTREASSEPSGNSSPSGPAASPASPAVSPGASVEPGWPAVVTIGPGDHLLWLGLDTPVAFTVRSTEIWRLDPDGTRSSVAVARLPSAWGPYFAVIGIPIYPGSQRLTIWPQGTYEVAATLDPGGELKTVRVEVQTLGDRAPGELDGHRDDAAGGGRG